MSANNNNENNKNDNDNNDNRYRCLVIDSGPIIKHTGLSTLYGKAMKYYTVPGVINEIRDSKARQHLQQLQSMELVTTKSPSSESIQQIISFSKLTGDYISLSKIDLDILALTLDLEKEGCLEHHGGSIDHIRTSPKRVVGLGQIQSLKPEENEKKKSEEKQQEKEETTLEEKKQEATEEESNNDDSNEEGTSTGTENIVVETAEAPVNIDEMKKQVPTEATEATEATEPKPKQAPKSWAMLVNPTSASKSLPQVQQGKGPTMSQPGANVISDVDEIGGSGGQFSDAEEEDEDNDNNDGNDEKGTDDRNVQTELEMDFPSLAAAATVPYEGSDGEEGKEGEEEEEAAGGDDEDEDGSQGQAATAKTTLLSDFEILEKKKQDALKPISKSGKLYNPLRKYSNLTKPKPMVVKSKKPQPKEEEEEETTANDNEDDEKKQQEQQSRIIGAGGGMVSSSEDMGWEEDDGEGWITCKRDIAGSTMGGRRNNNDDDEEGNNNKGPTGPPKSVRTACTTTDFAMQNVLLQMGLPLLSVDGVQIRKVKSWVYRCGACYKVHTDAEFINGMKRMFCSHCGSDMMQRISASVDGKTGRLKLHLSKNYKHNLRGTKFSLPKPGTGNKYQGELLLREDQLLSGAWNQKVKIRTGGQSRTNAQSMFGRDLASNVGCSTTVMSTDDVRVGFGRRNPNTAKGRERRGKKKKSSDRACGLRRY